MDDDLLADDDQFKDDGLDELDIDEEAALLGLSDEDIDSERITGNQNLEYVDEDGNPVEIGENNAELYEVAKYRSDKNRGTPTEDDVLDLDLDAELESFTKENADSLRESPVKTFNDRQCKGNLISLTSRSKPSLKRQESRRSPDRSIGAVKSENLFGSQGNRNTSVESFNQEYDEESEDEDDDDHRERFKSERSNIITLTPAKNRDIPDTLESVISVEETAKVQAFLENEQKRKMRYKGRNTPQMKNPLHHGRPSQPFPSTQRQQSPQFLAPAPVQQQYQMPPVPEQPRKILINPHFRGPIQPPVSEPVVTNHSPQVSAPQLSYNQPQNFAPPVEYSQDHSHQVNVAPPPSYGAPPPTMGYNHPEYNHPEYPQQQVHIQQIPPPIWQTPPPEMHPPPVSYGNPPPPINYGEPMVHTSGYHNYNPNNFQNSAYSPPQMPPPQMQPHQNINYNQLPPTVHHHPSPHSQASFASAPPANVVHFQNSQPIQQQNMQQKPYHEQRNVNQAQSHNFQRNNNIQNQHFSRAPEKRPSNVNIKHIPMKQPRLDHPPRKNVHVNNSNIREIPLVDTIKKEQQAAPIRKEFYRKPVIVEEEDEKTKELRMKIEEQKLLREQILKRKEERRRQMAAERLMNMQKRQQSEQNMNVISVPRVVEQKVPIRAPVQTAPKNKVNVRERIGMPMSNTEQAVKKKVVVVRRKAVQPVSNATPAQQNKVGIAQRLGNQPIKQELTQKIQLQKKPVISAPAKQTQQIKKSPLATITTTQPTVMKKVNPPNKNLATAAAKKIVAKSKPYTRQTNIAQQKQKGNIQQRLGNRGNFQRPPFNHPRPQRQQGMRPPPSPRFNGPRPPLPFIEQRIRFPGPMNEMRLPGPHFQDQGPPPFDRRPPPFEDQGPPPFERRPPPFEDQGPPPFDRRPIPFEDQGPPPFDRRPLPFEDQGPPPFREQRRPPFDNQRPSLLPFHSPEERPPFNQFRFENDHPHFPMERPGYQDFHPMRMDFPDRFPRPQFQNQMMRPQMFEPNKGPMFQRPRFHGSNPRHKFNNQQKKTGIVNKNLPGKTASNSPAKTPIVIKKEDNKNATAKLEKPQLSNTPDDIKPQSVCVENLSSSTSAMQLKKLCSSVGVVENIQLIKDQRKAVIKFKEPSQAVSFQKKFQRYMLDLAMIQVSLIPT